MQRIIYNFLIKTVFYTVMIVWVFEFPTLQFVMAEQEKTSDTNKQFLPSKFKAFLMQDPMENSAIVRFYAQRSYKPFWYGEHEKLGKFNKALGIIGNHGLPKTKYEFFAPRLNTKIYEFELLVMNNFIALISDLNSGILNPTEIDSTISVYPNRINKELILYDLETFNWEEDNFEAFVYGHAPSDIEYEKLLSELARLKEIAKKNDWGASVPEDTFLGYKLNHPNVGLLRTRLFKMGYLAFDSGSNLYDGEVKSAIQLFQADHGLNDDGLAGSYTLQAINIPARTRLTQVLVNLERSRWNDFSEMKKYILVNQPNFQAYLIEDDRVVWQSRVVIGLPEHQTQEFNDMMTHLIINPVWHVPRSISIAEYLPLIKEDPKFLEENDMSLIVRGTDQKIDPNLIDMSKFESNNFPFMIKQNPSNINALGVVKFMFPNEFNIYMHDTPMKELFFKDERTFSHGCVRVQDPFQFAFNLLSYQERDPEKKFQKFLQSKQESQINLDEPIPVSLVYRTVFFGDYGQPQYRSDIYGRDAAVFMALQDAGVISKI